MSVLKKQKYKPPYRKSPYQVRKALKELRKLTDHDPDPIVQRVAYVAECVLRWATEETVGWDYPAQDAIRAAGLIKEGK